MSAWGISNFENDTALDWVNEIVQEKEIHSIKDSIDSFLHDFSVEDTSLMDCLKFLTIAETVAKLLPNSAGIPAELDVVSKLLKIVA